MPKRLKETMIRSDFHMHTAFSTDSEEAVESMLNRAVERGLYSVCITDHMDADYPPDDEMGESAVGYGKLPSVSFKKEKRV
jgi:histidinol-phosphatase (PHP family)